MGVHQYSDHAGMRGGRSMSGARLWAEAEAQREVEYSLGDPNKLGAELVLLGEVAQSLRTYVPVGTDVIELGPGTLRAFKKKTMPLLRALDSKNCYIVDKSAAFLHDIKIGITRDKVSIHSIEADFFQDGNKALLSEHPALACAFGGIISNLVAPLCNSLPTEVLVSTLQNFVKTISEGWILVAFDSSNDRDEITTYYEKHALFQLNIFDRMLVELPMAGDFDPSVFIYQTEWRPTSRQLAHLAVAARNMEFKLGEESFFLQQGQKLHLKNSYKFAPDFFESCCTAAGLKLTARWSRDETWCYLLHKA